MTRLGLLFLRLLHHLPRPALAAIGRFLGGLLYYSDRGRIARINLGLCFPELDEAARADLARRHFRVLGGAAFEQTILWFGSDARVRSMIRLVGREHLDPLLGTPVILLAPHFVGLDYGGACIGLAFDVCSMYSQQKNPVVNELMLQTRRRWGNPALVSRQQGPRPLVRHIRKGLPCYYLPDMDFGARDAVFVPFFGVPAATVTALSRLVRATGAKVVPCVTRQCAQDYEIRLYPAWEDFPGESVEADTRRMNEFIEARIREMPEQYFWVHKRFKTRPPGERSYYDK